MRNDTICVAKTKALISCAVTAQLICAFGFAYADCWFSHAKAHIDCIIYLFIYLFSATTFDIGNLFGGIASALGVFG